METSSQRFRDAYEASAEAVVTLGRRPQATVLLRRLKPGESLGAHRHVRADVIHQILAGAVRLGLREVLEAPAARLVPRGSSCDVANAGEDEAVLLTVICPGVATLESHPFGSVRCTACTAEIPVEEGDVPGDRFLCPECTTPLRLLENDHGYAVQPDA